MKIKEISANIYLITSTSQFYLTNSFQRLAEFYESPSKKFKRKYFKKKQFNKWYSKQFIETYYELWSGFNIPDKDIKLFNKVYKGKN
jgi:hypothetical protein